MVAFNYPNGNINDYCFCHCHLYINPIQLCYCNCRAKRNVTTTIISTGTNYNDGIIKELNWRLSVLEKKIINKVVEKEDESTNPFEYIKVDKKGLEDMRHIKNTLYEFYKWLMLNVPDNKERSIAVTRLEEAAMWLNKSISRSESNEKKSC